MEQPTEDVPEHCPGPETDMAGKADACAGCPNQKICSSSQPKGPDPDVEFVDQRMGNVRHKILVLSGKGGVGKSTVTAQLAFTLAQDQATEVGVLDTDVCGPSIPRVMGLENEQVHQSGSGWSPIYADENLAVMSVGFLLPNPDDAVIWRGPKKNGMIKQFLKDVDWGELDFMVIDTPPGTSDEHLSIVQYLKSTGIAGAVIVTTPQEVSLIDVRKEINFCRKVNVPIIGVIENMAGFVCQKCGTETMIFPPTTGGAEAMCKQMNCELIGRLPLDPRIGKCCDEGKSFVAEHADTIAAKEYLRIVDRIKRACDGDPER